MEYLAPIGISTYSRINHLKKTIEALKKNTLAKESDLYVFSDAPREGDEEMVMEVRKYLRQIDGFKKVHVVERSKNNRVYNNRKGMKYLLDKYGKMIFMEDDVVTAPGFLQFMNDALDFYEKNKEIISVGGYSVPIKIPSNYDHDIYFLKRFSGWGFGIWKDRFDEIMDDCHKSKYNINFLDKTVIKKMKIMGDEIFYMVKADMKGELDALDVKITYQQITKDLYSVYPRKSLVQNIGHDGSGVHCGKTVKNNHKKLWSKTNNFIYISKPKLNKFIVKEHKKFRRIRAIKIIYFYRDVKKKILKTIFLIMNKKI